MYVKRDLGSFTFPSECDLEVYCLNSLNFADAHERGLLRQLLRREGLVASIVAAPHQVDGRA